MTPRLAVVLLGVVFFAELALRVAQWWESIGRAVTLPCPCSEGCS